jgi:hypothetical protein
VPRFVSFDWLSVLLAGVWVGPDDTNLWVGANVYSSVLARLQFPLRRALQATSANPAFG